MEKLPIRKGWIVLYIISLLIVSSCVFVLLPHQIEEEREEMELSNVHKLDTSPIVETLHNATPVMALASSSWAEYYPRSSPYPQYWGRKAIDGSYYEDGDTYDDSDDIQWLGDSEDEDWTVKFDLGQETDVNKIKFQFGQLYTDDGLVGMKRFQYDVLVERSPDQWEYVATDVEVTDPSDRAWMYEWMNGEGSTSLYLFEPMGSIVDTNRQVLKIPEFVMRNTYDYIVTDGLLHTVNVFDSNGAYVHDIYYGTVSTNVWQALNVKPTDVAILPSWPTYDGGYLISTDSGSEAHGRLWVYQYGGTSYINYADNCVGDYFSDLLQVATYWDEGSVDVFVLEKRPSDYILYHYERETLNQSDILRPDNYDHYIQLSYVPGNITAFGGRVYVVDETNDNVVVYDSTLSSVLNVISSGSGVDAFEDPGDITLVGSVLLVLDKKNNKTVAYEDYLPMGEFNVSSSGPFPKLMAVRPCDRPCALEDYGASIWVASPLSPSKHIYSTAAIQSEEKYFAWQTYTISGSIIGYRIDVHDMSYERHPIVCAEDPPKDTDDGTAWNRPSLVESFYDWEYDSDVAGIDLAITTPVDGENFVGRGSFASVPLHLDIDTPGTLHHNTPNYTLCSDTVTFQVDGGEEITILDGGGAPEVINMYPENWTLHNLTIGTTWLGQDIIFNDSITDNQHTYYEADIDFGNKGYAYKVRYFTWLPIGESNPGNVLEIFIDDEPLGLIDDFYDFYMHEYIEVEVGNIAIGSGTHNIKVVWRGGSGNLQHRLWQFIPHTSYTTLKKEAYIQIMEDPQSGIQQVTYALDFPTSTVYKFKADEFYWYTLDRDIWEISVDGTLAEVIDETYIEGHAWESKDMAAVYIEEGEHDLTFQLVRGTGKTLPYMKLYYDVYTVDGIIVPQGYHTIEVRANDTMGHEDSDSADFSVIVYPQLDIYSPLDESGQNGDVTLKFMARDADLDKVYYTINGGEKNFVSVSGSVVEYETVVSIGDLLENEWNQIEIVANDSSDHKTFGARTFFLDFTPPVIEFPGMANNTYTSPTEQYSINITDPTLQYAYYTINGKVPFELQGGLQTVTIPSYEFDEGVNKLIVYAIDQVGNNATVYLNLTRDDAAPVIDIALPTADDTFFNISGDSDPIPLDISTKDLVIDDASPNLLGIAQQYADDSVRMHYNAFTSLYQELISASESITDMRINARGNGRLKLTLREDRFFIEKPLSVGYVDIVNKSDFLWYWVNMSNTRLDYGKKYYLYVETLTPFENIYVSIGNDRYGKGQLVIGGIPRPHRDLTFELYYKEVEDNSLYTKMWYDVNGDDASEPVYNGSWYIANLTNIHDFEHGYNFINVYSEDFLGNLNVETVRILYIDTSVRTDIEVSLTSQTENEWLFGDITISWECNMPDYEDRYTRETYTHDLYLRSQSGQLYLVAEDLVDINSQSIDTTAVPDGFYRVFINSTDGTTSATDTSELMRVLNGDPLIQIVSPEDGEYINSDQAVSVSLTCADINDVSYSIDEGDRVSIEPYSFDFYSGYTYVFVLQVSGAEEKIRTIEVFVENSEKQTFEDEVTVMVDTKTEVSVEDMGTQSSSGSILIEYAFPNDAVLVTIQVRDDEGEVLFVELVDEGITGQYLILDGLPLGTYITTVTVIDRAGNQASDSVSFLVEQNIWADLVDQFFSFLEAIAVFILGIFGLAIYGGYRRKKGKKIPKAFGYGKCETDGTCEI